jgi:pyruvate dehydrogenase E1 component alpha subunit
VKKGRAQDPIPAFARYLLEMHVASEQDLAQIDQRIEREVEEAVRFAEESPSPALDSLMDFIYAPDDIASVIT